MEVSVEVHKIVKCTIFSTVFFFYFSIGVGDVLMWLLLLEKIIKDVNLMSISFSVIHPQIFRKL